MDVMAEAMQYKQSAWITKNWRDTRTREVRNPATVKYAADFRTAVFLVSRYATPLITSIR